MQQEQTMEVGFNPTPVTLSVPEPQATPAYEPLEWVRILCSQTGVHFNEIPKDVVDAIKLTPNKAESNKVFFTWLEVRVVSKYQFDAEDRRMFETAISMETNPEFVNLQSQRRTEQTLVTHKLNEIDSHATMIFEINEKIRMLTKDMNLDLTPEVEKIVKDGWWKYEPVLTKEHNGQTRPQDMAFIFTTPRINMAFANPAAGVSMNVDMGHYKVTYRPRRNTIRIGIFEDNVIVNGTMHPHIMGSGSDGSICWGNAANTYSKSMTDQAPSKAFAALRVLLQTYNDESPYTPITEFALVRNPNLFADKEIVKVEYQEAWIDDGDMPVNYDQAYYFGENDPDDDEDHKHHVKVFRDEYKGMGIQVPDSAYYMKLNDGTYAEVEINDWY